MAELTPKARELKNAYQRKWAEKHREEERQRQIDYWNRKAEELEAAEAKKRKSEEENDNEKDC